MKNVIIYSTPTCKYCGAAKDYFKAQGVPYTEYNVASDKEKRAEMVEKSGQMGVPVIEIGESVVVGYDEKLIADLLKA